MDDHMDFPGRGGEMWNWHRALFCLLWSLIRAIPGRAQSTLKTHFVITKWAVPQPKHLFIFYPQFQCSCHAFLENFLPVIKEVWALWAWLWIGYKVQFPPLKTEQGFSPPSQAQRPQGYGRNNLRCNVSRTVITGRLSRKEGAAHKDWVLPNRASHSPRGSPSQVRGCLNAPVCVSSSVREGFLNSGTIHILDQ